MRFITAYSRFWGKWDYPYLVNAIVSQQSYVVGHLCILTSSSPEIVSLQMGLCSFLNSVSDRVKN